MKGGYNFSFPTLLHFPGELLLISRGFSEVAEIAQVVQRRGQFEQVLKTQVILILIEFYEDLLRLLLVNNVEGKLTEFLNA